MVSKGRKPFVPAMYGTGGDPIDDELCDQLNIDRMDLPPPDPHHRQKCFAEMYLQTFPDPHQPREPSMDYEALEDRYSDKLERQEAAEQAHEAQATAEIRAAWAAFFSGTGTRVPALRHRSGGSTEEVNEPATEAMHDMLYDGAPQAALVALLQGRGDVQALRDAIVADYIYHHAQDIAQERAANDPMPFPAFLTQVA